MYKHKHKFENDFKTNNPINKANYSVEISMVKNKIFLLALENKLPIDFNNNVSFNHVPVIDNNVNIVLLDSLWKKQIQSMFMQIYYF